MEKFNSYNDTFKASNQLVSSSFNVLTRLWLQHEISVRNIVIDTARERWLSNNRISVSSPACLKVWFPIFGGNAQQLLPITNQLDRISGEGSGINTITQAQDRTPDSEMSGVMSASRVGELGGSVRIRS